MLTLNSADIFCIEVLGLQHWGTVWFFPDLTYLPRNATMWNNEGTCSFQDIAVFNFNLFRGWVGGEYSLSKSG